MIFGALLASQFLYAGILRVLVPEEEWTSTAFWPASTNEVVSILLLVAGVIWVIAGTLPTRMREAQLAKLAAQGDVEARFSAVLTSLIIRWAMLEAIVLVGFVLAILEKAPNFVWPLLGLAVSSMLAGVPTAARMKTWAGLDDANAAL